METHLTSLADGCRVSPVRPGGTRTIDEPNLTPYGSGRLRVALCVDGLWIDDPDRELDVDPVASRRVAAAHSWLAIANAWCDSADRKPAWNSRFAQLVVNDLDDAFAERVSEMSVRDLRRDAVARAHQWVIAVRH
jgi:hypothetical protein